MTGETPHTEGATPLPVPPHANAGPATATPDAPFYNPGMALNRDLSVLLVAAEAARRGRELDVADALCGAGARTLRLAHEVDAPLTVFANDRRPDAVATLRAGARALGVAHRVEASRADAHAFLASRRFDVVDVDPYGSPAPFLDAAVRATRHDGLVCITATDTAALCGAYARVARRRYGARHGLHAMPWRAEVGLRILVAAVVRAAARDDRGAVPVLSVARGHWMRVVCRVRDGRGAGDRSVARLRFVAPDDRGGGVFHDRMPGGAHAGPLWDGPLHDGATVAATAGAVAGARGLSRTREVADLLATLGEEVDAPAFWIDLDRFCGTRSMSTPRTDRVLHRLGEGGFAAARTHVSAKGVRTDAPAAALQDLCRMTEKDT